MVEVLELRKQHLIYLEEAWNLTLMSVMCIPVSIQISIQLVRMELVQEDSIHIIIVMELNLLEVNGVSKLIGLKAMEIVVELSPFMMFQGQGIMVAQLGDAVKISCTMEELHSI